MEDAEDSQRRIENDNNLKQIEESFCSRILPKETEYAVKSKENGQHRTHVFPDHSDFVILLVEIPDTHIIQSPDRG